MAGPAQAAVAVGAAPSELNVTPKQSLIASYGKLPLSFEANQGQIDSNVKFLSRGEGYHLYLTSTEAVLTLLKSAEKSDKIETALRMKLVGADPNPKISGAEELPGKSNYFVGRDPARWRSGVPTYAKVRYEAVYPGIDLIYYGNQRQLEYDFIVAPGADPGKIEFDISGADRIGTDSSGDLILAVGKKELRFRKPTLYQTAAEVRKEIPGQFAVTGKRRVRFEVGDYDRNLPLIIDPMLVYSSYLGGSGGESGNKISVDASGAAYIIGSTGSTDFPTTSGVVQPAPNGNGFFVAKIRPDGDGLIYSTYLGGSGTDHAFGIAVDSTGAAYISGQTNSPDYPTRGGVYQAPPSADSLSGFITKLNSSGSAIVYSSFLGFSAQGVAVDASGSAYVAGAAGLNFPTTPGAFQTSSGGAFFAKINAAGSSLVYASRLGGSRDDLANAIAVDAAGAAYVTGRTRSRDFPTVRPIQATLNQGGCEEGEITFFFCVDAFVTKINPAGNALVYSTYLGGGREDAGEAIVVDSLGNAYVAGTTAAEEFPTANAVQPTFGGGRCGGLRPIPCNDAFAVKIDTDGNLIYSTFIGGNANDEGHAIAVDSDGAAYIVGATQSYDFPTKDPIQAHLAEGLCDSPDLVDNIYCDDAFIAKINPDGRSFAYSTFLGGPGIDDGYGVALDPAGDAYVSGTTFSSAFPAIHSFQPALKGESDAFVAKVATPPPYAQIQATPTSGFAPLTVRFDGSASSPPSGTIQTYRWEFGDGSGAEGPIVNHTYTAPGAYFATLTAIDSAGKQWQNQVTVSAEDFRLTASAPSITAFQGGLAPFPRFLLSSLGAFNSPVEWTCSVPRGMGIICVPPASITPPVNQTSRVFLFLQTQATTPLGHHSLVLTGRSGTVSHQVTTDLVVVNGDDFRRSGGLSSTDLGPDWNEYLPDLTLISGEVTNADAGIKAAQFTRPIGPDQEVRISCMTRIDNSRCGVMGRWSNGANFYDARLDVGAGTITLYKTVNGATTAVAEASRPLGLSFSYSLRMVLKGEAISVYFNDESTPLIDVTDSAIKTGDYAGIRGEASAPQGIEFFNFSVTNPRDFVASASDRFDRADTTELGPDWIESLPDLAIFSDQVRNADAGNKSAVWIQSVGVDQDVSVDCKVTADNNACGVMARWSDENNFYRARLDVGQGNILLAKTVNGVTTVLGSAARTMQHDTYYKLRLVAQGSTLSVFFADETTPLITAVDASLNGLLTGIRSFATAPGTTWFDNFSATSSAPTTNHPPVARLSSVGPLSGPTPLGVRFDGSTSSDPDGTIVSYAWDFGDGTTASDSILFHTYATPGTYTATLTVTDNNGATGSIKTTITVTSAGTATLFEDDFDRTSGMGSHWKITAGNFTTDGKNAVSSGATSWAYVTKSLGTNDYTVEATLTVPSGSLYSGIVARGNPATSFYSDLYAAQISTQGAVNLYRRNAGTWTLLKSAAASISANQSYSLKLKVSGSNPVNLEVSLNGAPLFSYSDGAASRLLTGVPGIENYNSGVKYDRFAVTVEGPPSDDQPPIARLLANPTSGRAPLKIHFDGTFSSDSDGVISTFLWNFGDGATGAGSLIDHTYTAAGTYNAVLTVTDNAGATASNLTTITVETPSSNQPPVARIAADPISGTPPLAVHFDGTTSSDPDGTIASYAWSFGDGSSGSGSVIDHTYASAGTYTATLTVTDNQGATGSAQATITAGASGGSVLFNDEFNRTTGLGSNWRLYAGGFSTDGSNAVSLSAANYAAILPLGTNDYAVESVLTVPAGSLYSGIVARGDAATGFTKDLYAAQIATNNTVNLYRKNAGSWTQLESASAPIAAGTPYTLKLKISGSNPVNLEVSLNGNALFSFSDSTPSRLLSGMAGIENYDSNVKYDRFTVSAIGSTVPPQLQAITVTPPNPTIQTGATQAFTATGHFSDGSTQNLTASVTWASSNTAVATISNQPGSQGRATGVAAGGATISATDPASNISGSTGLTVTAAANQAPIARIAANPTSGTVPLTVHFDGSTSSDPDGVIASYAWSFGDGSNGTGATTDHTYTTAGTYTARLTVTDNQGAQATAQISVTVNGASGGGPLFTDDFNRTSGLGSNWSGHGGSFTTDGTFAVSQGSANWAAVVPDVGTDDYTVQARLIVPAGSLYSGIVARGNLATGFTQDAYAAQIASNGTVNLYRRNAYSWTLLKSVKPGTVAGQAYTLGLKVSGSSPVSLEVFLDGASLMTFSDSSAARLLSGAPGIENYNSGVKYDQFTVFSNSSSPVNQPPTAKLAANPTSGSAPLSVHFDGTQSSDPDGSITAYAWNFGDSTSGSGATADHTYSSAGSYTATLTVTDNQGVRSSAQA